MTSPIQSKGVPISSIFALYQPGTTKARASGIAENGNDTSNSYANIIYGSAAATTGIQSEGADLNTLYAKIGTANYPLPINGGNFVARSNGTISSAMDAHIDFAIRSDGSYTLNFIGNSPDTSSNTSGTWLPSGQSASDYQVEFVWAQTHQYTTGPATVTNGASTYQVCTTTRTLSFDAQVGQFTGQDKGSQGTITLNLKRVSTGLVTSTNFSMTVESVGTG